MTVEAGQRFVEHNARVERTVLTVSKTGDKWLVRCIHHEKGNVGRRSFISEQRLLSHWIKVPEE